MVNGGEYARLYEKKEGRNNFLWSNRLREIWLYTLLYNWQSIGYDFLVVDKDENLVQDLRTVTESAIVVDDYDKKSIKDSGVKNCDVVIVIVWKNSWRSLF